MINEGKEGASVRSTEKSCRASACVVPAALAAASPQAAAPDNVEADEGIDS